MYYKTWLFTWFPVKCQRTRVFQLNTVLITQLVHGALPLKK